jgi:GntR family transcriptional regulator
MNIQIDKGSDVTVHLQLAEQIVFLIATGKLRPGDSLPSVRQMAVRHKVHPNTVSRVYQDLVDRNWLKRHRGRQMTVRAPDDPIVPQPQDLVDLIDTIVRKAQQRGYSMQDIRKQVRERLLVEPPDHVLIVEDESGMRQLLQVELREVLPFTIATCSPDHLSQNQGPAIGALIVSLPGRVWNITSLLPRGRQVYGLTPCSIDTHISRIQKLKHPSLIMIVSVSEVFLETARNVLAPFAGSRHVLEAHLLKSGNRNVSGADLIICDSVCRHQFQGRRVVPYRLVSEESAREIRNSIASV